MPQANANAQPTPGLLAFATRHHVLLLACGLLVLGLVAYQNCFAGVFVFDDHVWITRGTRLRQLWPPSAVTEQTLRPVLFYSLAINYYLDGLNPFGYHLFNLAVHLAAGLVLFGLVRRTLALESIPPRFREAAPWLGCAVAALWMIHPLQTQAVDYTIQRAESMMALATLLFLWCLLRGSQSTRGWPWYLAAVLACSIGMGCKEVMIVAPPLALLFDRIYLATDWRDVFRQRGWVYGAILPATLWLAAGAIQPLWSRVTADVAPVKAAPSPETGSSQGVSRAEGRPSAGAATVAKSRAAMQTRYRPKKNGLVSAADYARSQPSVILHYLRLALWPDDLCLDYEDWPVAVAWSDLRVAGIMIFLLVVLTFIALWRWPRIGYLGFAFFLILAPTSSIMPIKDLAFEHRMYLPLAPLSCLAVFGLYALFYTQFSSRGGRGPLIVLGVVLAPIGLALLQRTISRNADYHSAITIYTSVVGLRPENVRARINLAQAYLSRSDSARIAGYPTEASADLAAARDILLEANKIDPSDTLVESSLGSILIRLNRPDEAIPFFLKNLQLSPRNADVHTLLAEAYSKSENPEPEKAIHHYRKAIEYRPGLAEAHHNLGQLLIETGNSETGTIDEGIAALRQALKLKPNYFKAQVNLGVALAGQKRFAEAARHFAEARTLEPNRMEPVLFLARAYIDMNQIEKAVRVLDAGILRAERTGQHQMVGELRKNRRYCQNILDRRGT